MSQNDFNLANQGFPQMRADINSAFQALASNSSGATAPSTTYAYQWWYDTSADILKQRNAANDGWIEIAAFDQVNDTWNLGSSFSTVSLNWVPDTDSTRNLGSASAAWAIAYLDAIEPVGTDTTIKRVGGTNSTPIVEGLAKAWVNFNGTGTIAARDSLNLSSLTDNGTGSYTVNFTNAFAAANFAGSGIAGRGGGEASCYMEMPNVTSASSQDIQTRRNSDDLLSDRTYPMASFHGDIA